jgi:hypothetical protein
VVSITTTSFPNGLAARISADKYEEEEVDGIRGRAKCNAVH